MSGNKARKFYALNEIDAEDFPDAVVSYGGPQSNAMVALAAIVSSKNRELERGAAGGTVNGSDENENVYDSLWELDVRDDAAIELQEDNDDIRIMAKDYDNDETDDDEEDNLSQNNTPSISTTTSSSSQPKKRFIYYTKSIPRYLKKNPNGNLLRALSLGMELKTLPRESYSNLFGGLHGGSVMAPADLDIPGERSLWMPQGGACELATWGSDLLAKEIVDFWSVSGKGMALAVCLPGGTCTTALLLHRSIRRLLTMKEQEQQQRKNDLDISVVVIPCVGDDEYAMRQMISLDKTVGGSGDPRDMPRILRPRTDIEYGSARRKSGGYFTFGQPAAAILETFDEMNEEGLNLDLVYGAPAFSLLLQHWKVRDDPSCPIAGRQIMYVHSGGLEGISSQMTRYKHNGLISSGREIMA